MIPTISFSLLNKLFTIVNKKSFNRKIDAIQEISTEAIQPEIIT